MTRSNQYTPRLSRTSNVIDFAAYYNHLSEDTCQAVPSFEDDIFSQQEQEYEPAVHIPRARRSHSKPVSGLLFETCASMAVIIMTLAFTLEVLA